MNNTMTPANEKKTEKVHQKVDPKNQVGSQEKKIEKLVLNTLGKPKEFSQIRARNVYSDRWRVDIFCSFTVAGEMLTTKSVKITDSFFIIFRDNDIFSSNPPLEPKYK